MRNAFIEEIQALARENKDIIMMVGDLGYGVLSPFREELSDQFYNAGIAEQAMTSIAAGMAMEGKTVLTYSIANFTSLRPLEQIRNDICYHDANVKVVSVGAGFGYGSLGMSHHATEDIAILRALPNMRVYAPCDKWEAKYVAREVIETPGPCYIRLDKGGSPEIHSGIPAKMEGGAIQVRQGEDACILAAGALASEAVEAADKLAAEGIKTAVYDFACVKPMNEELVIELAKKYGKLITAEEHSVVGGFGSAVAEIVTDAGINCQIKRIGLRDVYTSVVGSQQYLRQYYKMDSSAIIDEIHNFMEK